MENSKLSGSEVAIIGMAGLFPNSHDLAHWWQQLTEGKELMTYFSDDQLLAAGVDGELLKNPHYVKAGSILERDIALFDAGFFGFNPREAEAMDPQHRLFLEVCYHALETAGYTPDTFKGRIGVFGGQSLPLYLIANVLGHAEIVQSLGPLQIISGNDKDFITTQVSYKLNLKGPSLNVQTACSTSLVAVHLACQSLIMGECDMALAGAASINIEPISGYMHQDGGITSPDGHCRAFDAKASGTVFGSGVGAVVLKRLSDALADGDTIDAIILGSAVNNDGSLKVGYTAPSIEGQAEVIAEAQAVAGVSADNISYIETHGTGTNLGDPVEFSALSQAFRTTSDRNQYCAIGSVKSNMGHLDTVAGTAGLMKTVLQLKHKQIVPTVNFDEPNPKIDFANSPFYVNTTLQDWKRNGAPLRAGVSSFGIGGTNAHVVLQEAPHQQSPDSARSSHVLLLSAKTPTALESAGTKLASFLRSHPEVNLADAAYTLQVGRNCFKHRRAVLCTSHENAAQALSGSDPQRVWTGIASERRPLFFMFPGQGAQYVNMGRGLYEAETIFRTELDRCAELLTAHLGRDIRDLLYPSLENTEEAQRLLTQTAITQPVIFAVEYALAKLWSEYGVRPDAMIGHSIGEYVAACMAEVMTPEEALALVAARGRLMQSMPSGAMISINMSENEARPILSADLCLAAVNAPNLCVISGSMERVNELQAWLESRQIVFRRLQTSHAFHSRMMDPILKLFRQEIEKIGLRPPKLRFISNLTGTWIREHDALSPDYWVQHLRQTVRFSDGVGELLRSPDAILLEVGPGQTLTNCVKPHTRKTAGHVVLPSMRHVHDKGTDLETLLTALARIWVAGRTVQWGSLYKNERRRRISLPTYCFDHQRYWLESRPPAKELPRARAANEVAKKTDVSEWFYLPSWRKIAPAALSQSTPVTDQTWCVFVDPFGVGEALSRLLRERGATVITVQAGDGYQSAHQHFVIDPDRAEHYQQMWAELGRAGMAPARAVHLWTLGDKPTSLSSAEHFKRCQTLGFYSLIHLARAIQGFGPAEMILITDNVQEVIGTEQLVPENAPMLAACNVLPQEYPQFSCRSIDVQVAASSPAALADALLHDLSTPTAYRYIAHRCSNRWALDYEAVRLESRAGSSRLRERGVYLITGGLGNIGLNLAKWLATAVRARIVLMSRTPLPVRSEWNSWLNDHSADDRTSAMIRRMQEIESAGGEVLALSGDVSREEDMLAAVQHTVQRYGTLNGVFHGAGVLAGASFGLVEQLEPSQCEMHFAPKIHGLRALEHALRDSQPDFCILLSSISVVLGGLGYYPYSAANFFMDSFARSRNHHSPTLWSSINFDSWAFQGNDGDAVDPFAPLALTTEEGMKVFERLLAYDPVPQVVISVGDLKARMERWVAVKPVPVTQATQQSDAASSAGSLHARPELQNAYVAPRNELEEALVSIWQSLLGIGNIGIHDNFFDLGGHSLLATQVLSRVQDIFKVNLPLRMIFESPTVAEFADILISADSHRGRVQKIASLLRKVESMSAEDVTQALQNANLQREMTV